MALNSIKFGFNLPFILTTFMGMENKWINRTKNNFQQQQLMKLKKQKQQKSFYQILQRMSQIIDDLVNLQIRIKTNYMGIKAEKPARRLKRLTSFDSKNTLISQQSNNSDSFMKKNIKKSIMIQQLQKQNQKQEKIRQILKKHLQIDQETPNNVCQIRINPAQNLQKLNLKIDSFLAKVKKDKQKQKRVWQNFNKKKPSSHIRVEINNNQEKNKIIQNKLIELDQVQSLKTKNTFIKKSPQLFCS